MVVGLQGRARVRYSMSITIAGNGDVGTGVRMSFLREMEDPWRMGRATSEKIEGLRRGRLQGPVRQDKLAFGSLGNATGSVLAHERCVVPGSLSLALAMIMTAAQTKSDI